MASASARRGIRSRSISASASSCISSRKSCRAPPRRCWRCAQSLGATRIPTCCSGWCARIAAPRLSSRTSANRDEVAAILAAPNRIGVAPEVIRRTLDGRLKVAPDGTIRAERPLPPGRPRRRGAARSGAGGLALCADGALGTGAAVGRTCWTPPRRCSGPTSTTPRSARAGQSAGRAGRRHRRVRRPGLRPRRHRRPSGGLDDQAVTQAEPAALHNFCTCCGRQCSIESPFGACRIRHACRFSQGADIAQITVRIRRSWHDT